MEDWYGISRNFIIENYGGGYILRKYNSSPSLFVMSIFPEKEWIKSKFSRKKYSIGQIEWLEYMKITTPDILHMLNYHDGEFNIADGYSLHLNCIYEYNGYFWHGNPKVYDERSINPISKKSYGELYSNTIQKQKFCKKEGFMYKSVWESEWLRGKNAVIKIQKKYKNHFL